MTHDTLVSDSSAAWFCCWAVVSRPAAGYCCSACGRGRRGMRPTAARARPCALSTLGYPFVCFVGVLNGYSSTRVSLWDSLLFGRVLEY